MNIPEAKLYKKSLEIILGNKYVASMEYVGLCGFSKHLYFKGKLTLSEFLQFNLNLANYAKKQHSKIKIELFSNTGEYIPCIKSYIWKPGDWESRIKWVTEELIRMDKILKKHETE